LDRKSFQIALLGTSTALCIVGALVLKIGYLYPLLGAIFYLLYFKLDLSYLFFPLILFLEMFVYGVLGYGSNHVFGMRAGYSDIFLLLTAGILVLNRAISNEERENDIGLVFFFFGWILLFLISVFSHHEYLHSGLRMFQLAGAEPFLILLIGFLSIKTKQQLIKSTIFSALLFIPFGFWTLSNWGFFAGVAETTTEAAIQLAEATVDSTYFYRNKNISSAVFLTVAPVFTGFAIFDTRKFVKFILGAAAAVSTLVVFASQSRGAIVAMVAGYCIAAILSFKLRIRLLFGSIFIALVGTVVLFYSGLGSIILTRLFQEGAANRLELLQASLAMIIDNPITGIGLSENAFMNAIYFYSRSGANFAHPHNSYLMLAVFGGLPLFVWFIALIVALFKRPFRQKLTGQRQWLKWGLSAGSISFLIIILSDFHLFVSVSSMCFWSVSSMLIIHYRICEADSNV
jgi:O-antigen ligase